MFQAITFSNIWHSSKRNLPYSGADKNGLCFPHDKQSGGEQWKVVAKSAQCYS